MPEHNSNGASSTTRLSSSSSPVGIHLPEYLILASASNISRSSGEGTLVVTPKTRLDDLRTAGTLSVVSMSSESRLMSIQWRN